MVLVCCLFLTSCAKNTIDDKKIVVGASPSPHAEILEQTRTYIESKGYELEIRVYDDYILPNLALDEGELDANYFQHLPYLNKFNNEKHTNLVSVFTVHYEPLGLYAGKSSDLQNIPNQAKVAVPNDSTNYARALLLLDSLGLITVDDTKGIDITERDILENPHQLVILPFEAASIPAQLVEVNYAVINGNYAQSANVDRNKLLGSENHQSVALTTYPNIIAVKAENENAEAIRILIEALKQPNIKEYISNTYSVDTVLPYE